MSIFKPLHIHHNSQDNTSNSNIVFQSFSEGQYIADPKKKQSPLYSRHRLSHMNDQVNDRHLNVSIEEENKPIEVIIREELSKPILNDRFTSKKMFYYKRNIKKITNCFRQIQGIGRYLKFNCIDNVTLMSAVSFMEYEHFQPNVRIFKEGDQSDKFYGIITGRVSIRATKVIGHEVVNFEIIPQTIEEEKTVLGPGMCFGEWGIIHNIPRTASAYTTTETELFSLDKEYFNLTLAKDIIKADLDKKIFVTQKIPALAYCGKVQNILPQIVPTFHESGSVVYSEFDKAEYIYVLYQGECVLTKFVNPDKIEDASLQKEKMVTLFKVDKGGILGLETINSNAKYTTNLLVTRDFTVLYQIGLKFLRNSFVSIREFLRPMYDNQNELIQSAIRREMFIMENRKRELRVHTRNKNKSAESIITTKAVDMINDMTNKQNSPKGKLNVAMKQRKALDSLLDNKKKYNMFILPSTKSKANMLFHKSEIKAKEYMVSRKGKPNLYKDLSLFETSIRKQDCLALMIKKKKQKNEKKEMKKLQYALSQSQFINNHKKTPFLFYNTGSFDLPLVGQYNEEK